MFYLLTLGLAYGQDCTTPITSSALDTQLDSVAMGFLEMDGDKVQSGLDAIQANIPCLNETLDPIVAHEYHMLNGLYLVLTGDQESANQALRLAKRLAPEKSIPTHLFPKGHNIHDVYAGLEYIELDSDIPSADRGVYIFNGQTVNRALGTNNIVQIKEGSTILLSTIIQDGESLPQAPAKTIATTEQTTVAVEPPPVEIAKEVENKPAVESSTSIVSKKKRQTTIWAGALATSAAGMAATSYSFCGGLNFSNDIESCLPFPDSEADLLRLEMNYYGYYLFTAAAVGSSVGLTKSLLAKPDAE